MSIDIIFKIARLQPHPAMDLRSAPQPVQQVVLAYQVGNNAHRQDPDERSRFKPAVERSWECFAAGSIERIREIVTFHDTQIQQQHLRSLVSGSKPLAFTDRAMWTMNPLPPSKGRSLLTGLWRLKPECCVFVGSRRELVEHLERHDVSVRLNDGFARFALSANHAGMVLGMIEAKLVSVNSVLEVCDPPAQAVEKVERSDADHVCA